MTSEKRDFLEKTLNILIEKLKWDGEQDPDDLDADDKAAFEGLRKVPLSHFNLVSMTNAALTLLSRTSDDPSTLFHH
jgi:exportin-T